MEQHNRDLFPTQPTIDRFSEVHCLVVNKLIDESFMQREEAALRAKRRYHRLGRIAIIMIALGAVYTVAEALVLPLLPHFEWEVLTSVAAAMCVAFGILIQILIYLTGQKHKWLLNRFAAERLRAIKFLAYPLAEAAADIADLDAKVDEFYRAETNKLENQLNAGAVVLNKFSPREVLRPLTDMALYPVTPTNPRLSGRARQAYAELRIVYQRDFASGELQRLQETQRFGDTSADLLYLLGAILALAALVSKMTPSLASFSPWIDFLAVAIFIAGMSKAVLDNASLHSQSKSRYEQYVNDIKDAEDEYPGGALLQGVLRMERVALGELDAFCRAADKISYRL